MKTKTIFKTLTLAMMMPAMMLTTACSNDDDVVNNAVNTENTINKGYALPVTVNVTREGDAATRATYTESTGKLAFSAVDKLFVSGYYDGGDEYEFAGELDYVPATEKFSGTIYTSKEWTGTADALFTAATANGYVNATLLPAGYGSYGFLTIENNDTEDKYDDYIFPNNEYTFATSKAAGVEQFSYEEATSYSSSFALAPKNAILNFTITGLAASTNVAVSLTGSGYTITKTVTTDSDGKAVFGAGVEGGTDLNYLSLTVAGNPVTLVSSSKELAAGKIYNINRAAAEQAAAPAGAEAVDLGLSVKWANMNVGATSVTDNGDYFAWGETEPYYSSQSPSVIWKTGKTAGYDWASYQFTTDGGSSFTKYTSGGATLEAGDDAATANWGGSWRMPTATEFQELLQYTNLTWQTNYQGVSGCNGYLFTSRKSGYTDKSIFLPAAGLRVGSSLYVAGEYGNYWSSTLASDGVDNGRYFNFGSENGVYSNSRYFGYSVRPVTNAN